MADMLPFRGAWLDKIIGPGALTMVISRLAGVIVLLVLGISLEAVPGMGDEPKPSEERIRAATSSFMDGDCPRALAILDSLLASRGLARETQAAALDLKTKCLVRSSSGSVVLREFFCDVLRRGVPWEPNEVDFSDDVRQIYHDAARECRVGGIPGTAPPSTPASILEDSAALRASGRCADAAELIGAALRRTPEWPLDQWVEAKSLQARSLVCAGRSGDAKAVYRELLVKNGTWRPDSRTSTVEEDACFQAALEDSKPKRSKTWIYLAAAGAIGGALALLLGGEESDTGTISISVPLH